MNPIAHRSGMRLISVNDDRNIVILSNRVIIRSSMSSNDKLHPQQPQRLIIEILILAARVAASSGSSGVAGSSCEANSLVSDVVTLTPPRRFQRLVSHRFEVVAPLADGLVIAHTFLEDRSDRTDVDSLSDLLGGHGVGQFDVDLDTSISPRPLMLKIFLPVSRSRTNSTHRWQKMQRSRSSQILSEAWSATRSGGNWYGKRETTMSTS